MPIKMRRGFALLEVLIAVTIVGLAVPALMLRMQSINNTTAFIEEKTVAYWLAENTLQELYAEQALNGKATQTRRDTDVVEYIDREWITSYTIEEAPLGEMVKVGKLFRVKVTVARSEKKERILATLEGFLHEIK